MFLNTTQLLLTFSAMIALALVFMNVTQQESSNSSSYYQFQTSSIQEENDSVNAVEIL